MTRAREPKQKFETYFEILQNIVKWGFLVCPVAQDAPQFKSFPPPGLPGKNWCCGARKMMLSRWMRKNDGCLQPFGRFCWDTVWTNGVDFGVGLDAGGRQGGWASKLGGGLEKLIARMSRDRKMCFFSGKKNGPKRLQDWAFEASTGPFCMVFRCGSFGDGFEG